MRVHVWRPHEAFLFQGFVLTRLSVTFPSGQPPTLVAVSYLDLAKVRIAQYCQARSHLQNPADVSPALAKNKFARVRQVIYDGGGNPTTATCREHATPVEGQGKIYIRLYPVMTRT